MTIKSAECLYFKAMMPSGVYYELLSGRIVTTRRGIAVIVPNGASKFTPHGATETDHNLVLAERVKDANGKIGALYLLMVLSSGVSEDVRVMFAFEKAPTD